MIVFFFCCSTLTPFLGIVASLRTRTTTCRPVLWSRICDRITVECYSGLIWDLSLCKAIIQPEAQCVLCLDMLEQEVLCFLVFRFQLVLNEKLILVRFSSPELLLFQHIAIKAQNSSSLVTVFAEHVLCNFSDNQQSGWSVITAELYVNKATVFHYEAANWSRTALSLIIQGQSWSASALSFIS